MNNSDALAEVYFVLCNLSKDEYNRIPKKIINAIRENRNIDYRFNINKNLDIMQQTFLPETRAILFNLFKDYFATYEQKNKICRIQNKERENLYKNEKYDPNSIFKNASKNINSNMSLIEIKEETLFSKIFKLLKKLIKK